MTQKLQPVRGTKDFLPENYKLYKYIVDNAERIAVNYGYSQMDVPIFEFTEIFKRTLGETSDVVSKEMYSFLDRSGESITLRPEFTAGIARSVISNGLFNSLPLKFFSHGPLFRYERPQKGRYRQLHQLNCEYYGIASPIIDSEVINLAYDILKSLSLGDDITLELNSLGDAESRQNYHKILVEYFTSHRDILSEDSKTRLEKNPLRILDSKDENDKKIVASAPICYEYYNNYSIDYFEKVKYFLDILGIKYLVNPFIVRGLDYYCHTTFEFTTKKLGAQGTVLGGGRYDKLISIMSKHDIPAIGFAAGIERLSALITYPIDSKKIITIITIDDKYTDNAILLAQKLRGNDFAIEVAYGSDTGKKMKFANKINASFAIFLGEDEINNNNVKIRNLDTRAEEQVSNDQIIEYLKKVI